MISTLHARSALHSFRRLFGLGIRPQVIKEGLVGVFAQRLVGRWCCGSRCPLCSESDGYLGRVMVSEWIEMGEDLFDLVDGKGCVEGHKDRLKEKGVWFMEDCAESLVGVGITDCEGIGGLL